MGMAASQARLLSITSRMSDNELRSQIINNSKMRLATESSKVSEEYINALNSATMMMSNYDTTGESQYQKLSFNSLTSYSSYNNQYGLINANGKILVSEKDANIFREIKNTDGDLDDYLAAYGLEYKSTYFTEDVLGGKSVTFEDIGQTYTIEELEKMYYGDAENDILSYDQALQSTEYVNFNDYYNELILADENYTATVSDAINKDIFHGPANSTGETWESMYSKYINVDPSTQSVSYFKGGINYLKAEIQRLKNENKLENSDWLTTIESMIASLNFSGNNLIVTSTVPVKNNGDGTYTIDNNIKVDTHHAHRYDTGKKNDEGEPIYSYRYDNNVSVINAGDDETSYKITSGGGCTSSNNLNFTYSVTETGEAEDGSSESATTKYTYKYKIGDPTATVTYTVTDAAAAQQIVSQIILEFQSGIVNNVKRDAYKGTDQNAAAASEAYEKALDKYIQLVFGNVTSTQRAEISANKEMLKDPGYIITWAKEHGIQTSNGFELIKQIYLLDQLFNVYGEPSAGWIDVNNPDENADAKVQWYTNLYNRMEQGYAVLEDGLASSNEWIEFALESGLVTMEQVDTNNNWTSTIYTNISDITEVTDDAAVAKAEAEYNKAMNNIENKDKRYDMELKNIDTEHNSLQTEYDSVKSVIDKNIERSFKIYS